MLQVFCSAPSELFLECVFTMCANASVSGCLAGRLARPEQCMPASVADVRKDGNVVLSSDRP